MITLTIRAHPHFIRVIRGRKNLPNSANFIPIPHPIIHSSFLTFLNTNFVFAPRIFVRILTPSRKFQALKTTKTDSFLIKPMLLSDKSIALIE